MVGRKMGEGSELSPLRFAPLFKRYLWGGRRLGTLLKKPIGEGDDYAESWELADHGADQSVVIEGPLRGMTLGDVVGQHGKELLGRHLQEKQVTRFPLLFKFLDCRRVLSVQVHPNDAAAAKQVSPDLGKTEAWVILAAEPGSVVYAGLKRGFDRPALEREVHRGTTELCLHKYEPQVGDCIFIPAGTVHALGAGLVVAEIQQASDTTFRLFDWNRVGPDGKPRQLHVEESLAAINYSAGPVQPQIPQSTERPFVQRLVSCDKFVLDRWQMNGTEPAAQCSIGGDERFHILSVLAGSVKLSWDASSEQLTLGQTVLIPASAVQCQVSAEPGTVMLDSYLP
ncbi:MAG: type I phosphomannose isomerase catalytic subunit [Pirellulaceae bacterium]